MLSICKSTIVKSLTALLSIVCLCLCLSAWAISPVTTLTVPQKIERLVDLFEIQPQVAINELTKILSDLPPDVTLSDKRDVLDALIELNIRKDQQQLAQANIEQLETLALRYNDEVSATLVLNFKVLQLENDGNFQAAKKLIDQALEKVKTLNDKKLTSRIHITAGLIYQQLGDFQIALQHLVTAIEYCQTGTKSEDLKLIQIYKIIGTLYDATKNTELSLEYNAKATELALKIGAKNQMASLTNARGVAYTSAGRFEDAKQSYFESLSYARASGSARSEVIATNNLSDVTYHMGRYPECLQFGKETLVLAEKMENNNYISSAQINIGLCRMALGDVKLGAKEVNLGLDYLRKTSAKPDLETVLGQLAVAYQKAGMYREGFDTLNEQRKISSELFGASQEHAMAEMKEKYEAHEREKQIELLEQKNQTQRVEIVNKSLQRVVAILATIIALATAATVFLFYRKLRNTNRDLEKANLKLAHQSTRDPLTGLLNRRAFNEAMKFRTQLCERRVADLNQPPHALVLLDIDFFKKINDNHGHAAGDAVLVEISRRLNIAMREKDMLMRWGGEEFLIFLNHIPEASLELVIERLLISVGARPVMYEKKSIGVTISAGFISLPQGEQSEVNAGWEQLLKLADSALYMAKMHGRNQAIGVTKLMVPMEEIEEVLINDFESAIKQQQIEIQKIPGPEQAEVTIEL